MADTLGERLKNVRLEANLSQEELGTSLELAGKTIRRYEKGRTQPTLVTLRRIAEITQTPVAYFLEVTDIDEEEAQAVFPRGKQTLDTELPMVYVRAVDVDGMSLAETENVSAVPRIYLDRASLPPERARVFLIPTHYYLLRRAIDPATTLLLWTLYAPTLLGDLMDQERWTDGLHLVGVGRAGPQAKWITRDDLHTVLVQDLSANHAISYPFEKAAAIRVYARVVAAF